mgnify:CR=1 FL=1
MIKEALEYIVNLSAPHLELQTARCTAFRTS